ncbi:MAG: hypothetical protein KC925_02365 [Candidatus Doudnabacteria bacterium]|nr:hypothetical protein [Candidatus Doudnabacteria bacterium]
MGSKRLRALEWVGIAFGIILGTLLHFTFAWSGENALVGLFSAVNESVWEHTKLLVTPIVLFGVCEWFREKKRRASILEAKALELVVVIVFIIAFFYSYTGMFGIEANLGIDIASFVVAVVLGKWVSGVWMRRSKTASVLRTALAGSVVGAVLCMQIGFTIAPPDIPLFQEVEHSDTEHE